MPISPCGHVAFAPVQTGYMPSPVFTAIGGSGGVKTVVVRGETGKPEVR